MSTPSVSASCKLPRISKCVRTKCSDLMPLQLPKFEGVCGSDGHAWQWDLKDNKGHMGKLSLCNDICFAG
jgi:hypothetical protein